MLSNQTLRVLTLLGLLLPVLVVALRMADSALDLTPLTCEQMTTDMSRLDNVARLPTAPALLLGDSTARHWPTHIDQLDEHPLLVRGFIGLTPALVNECFPRLVGFYRPSHVVLFLESAEQRRLETELADQLKGLQRRLRDLKLGAPLIIVGLLETPASDRLRVGRLNQAAATVARGAADTVFIDPNALLATPEGAPDPRAFWPDGDTLAEDHYAALAALIAQHLQPPATAPRSGIMRP
jgi:hypothetical protein